jgi:alpha-glucosidase
MIPLLHEFRSILDAYPQRYSVGETFIATAEKAASYIGNQLLHAAFSFDFTSLELFFPWNPVWVLKRVLKREEIFQDERWPATVMSNHDLPRAASRYSRTENDAQARLAMTLLLTLRGTPFLYYGEEIGMRDISLSRSQIMDPPGKRYWPIYKGRDGCRSPMQWDGSAFAGFSSVQPWLPLHSDYLSRNAAQQEQDPASMLNFTRTLIDLRKQYPALQRGSFTPLASNSRHVLAYLRQIPGQTVLVALNFSGRKIKATIDPTMTIHDWQTLLPTAGFTPPDNGSIELSPYMICLLVANN